MGYNNVDQNLEGGGGGRRTYIVLLQPLLDPPIKLYFDLCFLFSFHASQWIVGTDAPKDFIGASFQISFHSDSVETGGTGFALTYDQYTRGIIIMNISFVII